MTIRRALVPVVLLACVALATSCAHTTPPVCPESETRHWEVAPEWLQGRVDPPGIEARWRSEVGFAAMREDDQRLLLSLFRRNLAAFSEKLHPGDEIRFFSTPARDWKAQGGRSGFVAIRDCRVVAVLVARES